MPALLMTATPFKHYRSGSSKGFYFLRSDLPDQMNSQYQLVLDLIGRDASQIDGLGGGHPLSSKVAIVGPSAREDADVDYQFMQIVVGENRIDTRPNCGNILAAVGPFAIETGLVSITGERTSVRVNMVNSGLLCTLQVSTPNEQVRYAGSTELAGVPNPAAAIHCNYVQMAGSTCGDLFPTGNTTDEDLLSSGYLYR